MSRSHAIFVLAATATLASLSGCGAATTRYDARVVAPGELTLRYNDGIEFWSAGRPVARGLGYHGLPEFVRCVPRAKEHALAARSSGAAGVTLSVFGGVLAVGGLGGLGGLAVEDKNRPLANGLLMAGVGAEVLGLILAGIGRQYKVNANGHAVDAMNFYNDQVGSLGGSCSQAAPGARTPPVEAPAAPAEPAEPDDAAPPANAPQAL
jgi:hypothetical protein